MAEDRLLYVGQKAFINKNGEVLVLTDPVYGLDFPGGKVQVGENNFAEALEREVQEETDLKIDVGDPFDTWYFEFKEGHRNAGKQVYLVGFKCKFISGEVKISNEHTAFKWVNRENYAQLEDEKDPYYRALRKYFEGA